MTRIKSFLIVLSIIGLFVFASCKNSFTPKQVKVACNAEKTTIKGVAKIGDAFVPHGTKIRLFINSLDYEDMWVSDDEGHFESEKQYDIDKSGKVYALKIIIYGKTYNEVKIANSSQEDVVYNFELTKIKIRGMARKGEYYAKKGTIIQLLNKGKKVEDIIVSDDKGHFESVKQLDVLDKNYTLIIDDEKKNTWGAEILLETKTDTKFNFKIIATTLKGTAATFTGMSPVYRYARKGYIIYVYKKDPVKCVEEIPVYDDDGHFESNRKYSIDDRKNIDLQILGYSLIGKHKFYQWLKEEVPLKLTDIECMYWFK